MIRHDSEAPAPPRDRGLVISPPTGLTVARTRRDFLRVLAGSAAVLGLGPLAGCAEDTDEILNPDDLLLVWLGQTLSGRVTNGVDRSPVAGATVTFEATINPQLYIFQGQTVTTSQGTYAMDAKDSPGGGGEPGAYWRFAVPESRQYTVYLRVTAGKSGLGSGSALRTVTRIPSKEPPRGSLAPYQLTQDVTLAPI